MHRDNTCDRVFNSITTPIRTTRQTHEIRRMSVNDEGCEITDAAQSRQKNSRTPSGRPDRDGIQCGFLKLASRCFAFGRGLTAAANSLKKCIDRCFERPYRISGRTDSGIFVSIRHADLPLRPVDRWKGAGNPDYAGATWRMIPHYPRSTSPTNARRYCEGSSDRARDAGHWRPLHRRLGDS